ncbi:SAP30-binding protein [Strongyloides ratti]|uniref:SAP30-binding protein n=1 Tax=Strongyloides ratti TaxID=34506 RepID=A0A090LHU1_STRRB|nr:SAP30-binding protein [Strongyloides ratti]CEF69312.1 SAP30-binding protein [Strongyloides ratti]
MNSLVNYASDSEDDSPTSFSGNKKEDDMESCDIQEPKPPKGHNDQEEPEEVTPDGMTEQSPTEVGGDNLKYISNEDREKSPCYLNIPLPGESVENAITLDNEYDFIQLPPSPNNCDPELEELFIKCHQMKKEGYDFTEKITGIRSFKNPSSYTEVDYYNKIAEVQNRMLEKIKRDSSRRN